MRLRNVLEICLVFWKTGHRYAYKRYVYVKKTCTQFIAFTIKIVIIDFMYSTKFKEIKSNSAFFCPPKTKMNQTNISGKDIAKILKSC